MWTFLCYDNWMTTLGTNFSCGTDNSSTWTFKVCCLEFLEGNDIHLPVVQDLSIDLVLSFTSHSSTVASFLPCKERLFHPWPSHPVQTWIYEHHFAVILSVFPTHTRGILKLHYWKRNKLFYLTEQAPVSWSAFFTSREQSVEMGKVYPQHLF